MHRPRVGASPARTFKTTKSTAHAACVSRFRRAGRIANTQAAERLVWPDNAR
ncbi:MAG: hypothetical protein AVDCRST_MAG64-1047 [uncultured Phycisphaerae bacterium]|uniref:Uncharacterized protein n=1 Tax=uncultured Phycisphaerae bacterium TaxID=904963 RepID=A0A6J4NMA2_9BACT|nr:MAG: hypothetical protein AVDCRST_MAG64-1047 [uncultured Phycisphaerae bacterium]